jgi:GH15 family glucan-1,4-alpha-glucosidase
MDLVSAARRLSHPFLFSDRAAMERLPLSARGLIGDGFTAALVSVDGAIDWLCFPRFDSPSVFARILDGERGGSMAVRPASCPFESVQQYDPETNVLETLMTSPGKGAIRIIDSMPWSDDPRASIHEIHRRIDCPGGEVEVEIVFDPRFDYARDVPRIHLAEHGLMGEGRAGERLALSVSRKVEWETLKDGGARGTIVLREGMQLWCVLSWGSESVAHFEAHRPFEHLRVTRRKWREWAARLTYDGPWRHHVLRSALTLKLLMYAPTGAVVAAPTTSLPEWLGGARNWDYRFTWTRDSAMAIRSANLIGYGAEARDFYHFLRDAVDRDAGLQLMYTVDGQAVPPEEELAHLAGSFGSRPVRIGNGARDQLQLDTTGAIADAAQLFERFGGTLTLRAWTTLASVIERACDTWKEPDHGIWEPRHGKRHNVHSKLMNWLAMDRGAQVALAFGRGDLCERWSKCAKEIHSDILTNGMDATRTRFVSVYGEDRPDATLLLLPIHGFLPDDDVRVRNTVAWVRERLSIGPFLYRYQDDDGVAGPEGAFILCGFWLAEALALQGNIDEASRIFTAHVDASNHLGLLAEELAPDGQLLGNFPQAFSHLGLINAALRIDLALRLRDEGSPRSPHLVGSLPRKAHRRGG